MFVMDSSSHKTYLDLKNYLYNHNYLDNVDLSYFYFNYQNAHCYNIKKYNTKAHLHITKDIESDYTKNKYGYIMTFTLFVEALMSILKNYINGKDNLLDIENPDKLTLNTIEWNTFFGHIMSHEKFNTIVNSIPKSDIYCITNRLDTVNTASIAVEVALALYLIRKYNSKVFMGGGSFNQANNIFVELINAIGKEYTNGKLEYLVGTIGINIYNYLQGYEYQNKRSPIERSFAPLDIPQHDMIQYFHNQFHVELIRGCRHKCLYCCNGFINNFDRVDIAVYKDYFQYLNTHYPQAIIYLFAPEMNTDKDYFINVCRYLHENVVNPISLYVNMSLLDDEELDWLLKLNICEIKFSIDGISEKNGNRKYNNLSKINYYLSVFQKLKREKGIDVYSYIVANIPGHPLTNWNAYKEYFINYPDILAYSEFYIFTSTDYFYNPQKYGISFLYFQNRYKELSAISDIISKIPVMYFRNDVNRKELVNMEYDILRHMKKQIFIDMCKSGMRANSNIYFTLGQMCHLYPDLDLIDTHDKILDDYIISFTNNIGYKQRQKNLSATLHSLFDKKNTN